MTHLPRRSTATVTFGVALLIAVLGPASASASLVGDVVEKAASTVAQVTAPVVQAPPSAPAPSTSPPVTASAPELPVKLPLGGKPAPSAPSAPSGTNQAPAGEAEDPPGVGDATAGAREAAAAVTSARREAAERVIPAAGNGAATVRESAGGRDAPAAVPGVNGPGAPTAATVPGRGIASGGPPRIDLGRAALLPRLLARVWPAIALGSGVAALAKLAATLPFSPVNAARLLLAGSTAPLQGVLARSASAPEPSAPVPAADGISLRTGLEISLFVICAFGVLLAVLGSSLWVELRAARYRW